MHTFQIVCSNPKCGRLGGTSNLDAADGVVDGHDNGKHVGHVVTIYRLVEVSVRTCTEA